MAFDQAILVNDIKDTGTGVDLDYMAVHGLGHVCACTCMVYDQLVI